MNSSKEFLKKTGYRPRISFTDGRSHTVVLLKDKIDTITDDKGGQIEGVQYLVTESGEEKTFFTGSQQLIQRLSDCEIGERVTIVMKKKKTPEGFKSYFDVSVEGAESVKNSEEPREEIPF